MSFKLGSLFCHWPTEHEETSLKENRTWVGTLAKLCIATGLLSEIWLLLFKIYKTLWVSVKSCLLPPLNSSNKNFFSSTFYCAFLQLDRTYTGLQTLGAETVSCICSSVFCSDSFSEPDSDDKLYLFQVVDVELHRNSLGDDYIPQPSSSKVTHRAASPMSAASLPQSYGRSSSPVSHDLSADKGIPTEAFNRLHLIT